MSDTWICPVCRSALSMQAGVSSCAQDHHFDHAKEGYVNLLLAQHRNSKAPGDNKEMIRARRAFLQLEHYAPLANCLAELMQEHVVEHEIAQRDIRLFDAGCGEGYYLHKVLAQLPSDLRVLASGIDISKWGVQKAAKLLKQAKFAVASTYNIPLPSASQDIALQVFAPSSNQELQRILNDQGIWIIVSPGPSHLFEVKQIVYKDALAHAVNNDVPEGFELLKSLPLRFQFPLHDAVQRENLLMMTPFYWTIGEQNKQRLLNSLDSVTADFRIAVLRKSTTTLP